MTKTNLIKTNLYLFIFFLLNTSVVKAIEDPGKPGDTNPGLNLNSRINITIPEPTHAVTNIGKLITSGITAAIVISGLLTFVYLVWGGIEWLTSGGDKTKMEEARGKITAAVIGLAIVAAAYAVMTLIAQFFGLDLGNLTFPTAVGQ